MEMIVGVGRGRSMRDVLATVEREFSRPCGAPVRLLLIGSDIEIEAERRDAESAFESWKVRLTDEGLVEAAVQALGSGWSPSEVSGPSELQCSGVDTDAAFASLDRLADVVPLSEVWRVSGSAVAGDALSPEALFLAMRELNASDIHLFPGARPRFRVDNRICDEEPFEPVSTEQITGLVRRIAPAAAWTEFERHKQCSFNYHQAGIAYSRVSAFIKTRVPHCTIRFLPEKIPTFEDLRIPEMTMAKMGNLHTGLVLISGMTGSGKSTTVASLVDWINQNRALHVLTIENPVEFVHVNKQSIISQRDVGTDAESAVQAVQGAVRHDPDVIVIGEMKDADTIRAGIDAASTGHLVISTFHANTAAEAPNRIVSYFEPVERDLVRLQLRECLQCVVCQRLLPALGGGRVPALEFLFNDTQHIRECILTGNSGGMRVAMQQTISDSSIFEESLLHLVRDGLVDEEVARDYASNRDVFDQMRLGTYVVPSLDQITQRR